MISTDRIKYAVEMLESKPREIIRTYYPSEKNALISWLKCELNGDNIVDGVRFIEIKTR